MHVKIRFLFSSIILIFVLMGSGKEQYAAVNLPVSIWELENEERYVYRYDLEKYDWKEIRNIREQNKSANMEIKVSRLKLLRMGSSNGHIPMESLRGNVSAVMRDPDGKIHKLASAESGSVTVKVPVDGDLIGRYILGAHCRLGEIDTDGNGTKETVFLSAKQLISHYKNGGKQGSASVVFIDDAEYIPLEIGPVINTAENKYGGGTHRPHHEYEFMVKYMNKPLPGAKVVLYALGSRWQKEFITDKEGMFEVIPTDDRTDDEHEYQKYVYVAEYNDRKNSAYHISSLPVIVYRNRPEWMSKAMGFTFWSFIGIAVIAFIVYWLIRRSRWQEKRKLVIYENYKIREEA